MPYRREHFDAEKVLEHNGVSVYACYDDDEFDPTPLDYWYVLNASDDISDDSAFDVRDIDIAGIAGDSDDHMTILKHAIETGQIDADGKHHSTDSLADVCSSLAGSVH